ncbi:MAG: MCE family protein [Candidatus Latescibacteria bacterium]|nr:MCE family protein [bacterium]MBD3423496.1 MCE family protein [Candidatus Latescibacterota bacterium]
MNTKALELKVGITIFVAFIIFVVGMMWLEGFKLRSESFGVYAEFDKVGGIGKGDAVNVDGVERGVVKSVTLDEQHVVVAMRIDAGTVLPVDSRVHLRAAGMLGERVVSIIRGSSDQQLEDGDRIRGYYEPGLSETFGTLTGMFEDLRKLTNNVEKVLEVLTDDDNLRRSLENLSTAAEELRALIVDTAPNIRSGASAFRSSSVAADSLLANNAAGINRMISRLDSAAVRMPRAFARIDTLSGILLEVSRKLNSKDNSAGALLTERELLDKLQSTIDSLQKLIKDIEENPGRYLKLEIF